MLIICDSNEAHSIPDPSVRHIVEQRLAEVLC